MVNLLAFFSSPGKKRLAEGEMKVIFLQRRKLSAIKIDNCVWVQIFIRKMLTRLGSN